uniref:ELYS-like domain-containing protein n=1 Tax=Ananas comosus var. bracteatus TaxID=296719 RepID=A0A6V7NEC1_ANACO|nr:unnamed protein product [Ananas comosus var. bracteatus]
MKSELCSFQKFASQLAGISSVLEVMVSLFKDTFSAQLPDLHQLLESTLKAEQHLEVMIWCTRHNFLEGVQSHYSDPALWNLHVAERKLAAVERSWPKLSGDAANSFGPDGAILFIEQALENLGIEQTNIQTNDEEVDILCLLDENSPLFFLSKVDKANRNGYPFRDLRVAADVLFLRGTSDTVVAKRAVFLYHLFDRHWTRPEVEWKYLIDDFAATFGITKHSLLESLVFYLLDDHSVEALQEANHLLQEIAGRETHPKIAQVLLERHCPDAALSVQRCTGRDDFCSNANIEHDSLGEAVTAVRVRIECGLLTEAFMYHRMHCSKVKESKSKHAALSNIAKSDSWLYHVEVLVTEIYYLCMRRNLLDRMIELPWDSVEEKCLHKCLLDHACQRPSEIYGSLLVVFYLQRYRYSEAYQVDRKLQNLELSTLETASEDEITQTRLIARWRQGLVVRSLELLPEVERQKVVSTNVANDLSHESPNHSILSSVDSFVLQNKVSSHLEKYNAHTPLNKTSSNSHKEFGSRKAPTIIQRRLLTTPEDPINSKMNLTSASYGMYSSKNQNGEISKSKGMSNVRESTWQAGFRQGHQHAGHLLPRKFHFGSHGTPLKEQTNTSSLRLPYDVRFQEESIRTNRLDFTGRAENSHLFSPEDASLGRKEHENIAQSNVTAEELIDDKSLTELSKQNLLESFSTKRVEEANIKPRSFREGGSPVEYGSMRGGSRWRSDESTSEDEVEDHRPGRNIDSGVSFSRRRARISRR